MITRMKDEFKSWFINEINNLDKQTWDKNGRSYTSYSIETKYVPFHSELKRYIYSLDDVTNDTDYKVYHIHLWKEGDYFDEHRDDNFNRKWSYVCELKPSECKTHLLVEGNEMIEGIFDCNTLHQVPPIQNGHRISLTVFGVNYGYDSII